jgi:hypothetical protein
MNILSTIHTKYQGETMFCFVCVATVFGYILGVNRVIDAIISKHSDERRAKVVNVLNKYTQTNLGDLAELLVSNNLILSSRNENDASSSDQDHNSDDHDHNSDHHDHNSDDMNDDTSKVSAMLNYTPDDTQEKQEKQENAVMSPSSISSVLSISTSEEDYELVRKNENGNHSKNKNNVKYFEWLNIF